MTYAVRNIHLGKVEFVGTFSDCENYIQESKLLGSQHAYKILAA